MNSDEDSKSFFFLRGRLRRGRGRSEILAKNPNLEKCVWAAWGCGGRRR